MENDMKKRVLEQLRIVRRALHCKHEQNEVCIECKAKIKGDVSGIEGNVIELIKILRGGKLAEAAGSGARDCKPIDPKVRALRVVALG